VGGGFGTPGEESIGGCCGDDVGDDVGDGVGGGVPGFDSTLSVGCGVGDVVTGTGVNGVGTGVKIIIPGVGAAVMEQDENMREEEAHARSCTYNASCSSLYNNTLGHTYVEKWE